MEKDYKIEMKPTYWDVMLTEGCYSDYEERHLYFCANTQEEVWIFLKRYLKDIWDEKNCMRISGVSLEDEHCNIIDKYAIQEDDWGDWRATIKRLNVIYFNKY